MSRVRIFALSALWSSVALGQERAVQAPPLCDSTRPSDAQAVVKGSPLASLAGRYRLLAIDTANVIFPSGRGIALELERPDSAYAQRENERDASYRRPLGLSVLVGVEYLDGQRRWRDQVKLRGATLIVGCPDYNCLDGVSTYYFIDWYSGGAFGGHWKRPETGLGVPIDPITRKRLPDGAGYYCALRETDR